MRMGEATVKTVRKRASSFHLPVVIYFSTALALGACGSDAARIVPDDVLRGRVEAAVASASDLPENAITVEVSNGVVTLTGSVVCEDCGGLRTPGGSSTIQQSLGAVVRAIPGVQRLDFELEYETPAGPSSVAGG
jgi:hypothetical protein